jgi:hypothetical protein
VKTATVDAKKRVLLGQARPGDCYKVEASADGERFVLVRMAPEEMVPPKVRLEKRKGHTVLVSDRPISQEAIDEALAEFP